jgi:GNAT superfamily N-acetyltransferase
VSPAVLRVVPANQVAWEDLALVFGTRGPASRCYCQRSKLARGESFGGFPLEERAERLREQTRCGEPSAETTSGLVALLGDEPIGWVAVEPRPAYVGMVRNSHRAAWVGRDEDREDTSVWAVTCVLARAGHRRQGLSGELVRAAVEHARQGGARVLEGYPMTTNAAIEEELHVGSLRTFLDAGFEEVGRPSTRRAVVRVVF